MTDEVGRLEVFVLRSHVIPISFPRLEFFVAQRAGFRFQTFTQVPSKLRLGPFIFVRLLRHSLVRSFTWRQLRLEINIVGSLEMFHDVGCRTVVVEPSHDILVNAELAEDVVVLEGFSDDSHF